MRMSTLKQTLEKIHSSAANEFLRWLEDGIPVVGEDGVTTSRRPNAQEMNAMIKFLKDNGIDRVPKEALTDDDPFALLLKKATERTNTEAH
jgi:hypothetical protein